jgi:hypothetical protein
LYFFSPTGSPPAALIFSCSKVAVFFHTTPQGAPGPLKVAIIPILRVSWAPTPAEEDKANPRIKAKTKIHCFILSIFALPLINDLIFSVLPVKEINLEFLIKRFRLCAHSKSLVRFGLGFLKAVLLLAGRNTYSENIPGWGKPSLEISEHNLPLSIFFINLTA